MNKNIKKILVISILILTYIIISCIWSNNVFAINQTTTTDINSIDSNKYPKIKEVIQKLKEEHSNWNFKILYTDIDWNEVIANEYVGHGNSPRNLVPANNSRYDGDWICKACGEDKLYDSGKWHCASEAAIAYMIDPRNSTNNSDIFQFMELTYNGCNIDTVKKMVANTFLNNESYINTIIVAAEKYNVNVYYIVARILQEQGNDGSVLVSGQGYNGEYIGVYNVFNIGASGNGKENVIINGLKKAQAQEWTTLEKSIDGGVSIIASSYIAKGQNTLYLQKFDVDNSDGNLYWHQYMQNILAAQAEGETLKSTFESVGAKEGEYTFIIPLYENMPTEASTRPSTTSTTLPSNLDLVKINVNKSLRLRNAPNGTETVGWVYKDEIVTRLVKATQRENGTYWDYVMKADGTKGYAARETYEDEKEYKLYLVPIEQEKPLKPVEPELPEKNEDSETTTIIKNDKVKIDASTNEIVTIPNATVQDVLSFMGENTVIKNVNGEVLTGDSKLATGCVINDSYTVSVLGDINGDGEIDTGDTYLLKLVVLGHRELEKDYYKKASDVNQDGEIDTGDTFLLKKQVLNMSNITL